ncbi:MAG: hypothetical protein IT374_22680 [Polyangiaceae bacterium]|nr:hypothetical protein [Polyangiaceae bacterium]
MKTFLLLLPPLLSLCACGDGDSAGQQPGAAGAAGAAGASAARCASERTTLLGSVDAVAPTDVKVVSAQGEVKTLYVDASAGGPAAGGGAPAAAPWVYLALERGEKAPVTDVTALTSTAWDLALRRASVYVNSGDGGPGVGGAVLLTKDFDAVTSADVAGATFATEAFFDASCAPKVDGSGAVETTLSAWYSYDPATHSVSPAPGTWLVRGATGGHYKVKFETYHGTPEGGEGTVNGRYLLRVGAL